MLLTVESHELFERRLQADQHLRVFIGDRDVTNDCQAADNRHGWALLFERNERGSHFLDGRTGERARTLHLGTVRFVVTDHTGRSIVAAVPAVNWWAAAAHAHQTAVA